MLLIVRLYATYELRKVWDFVESEFGGYESGDVIPLFASHAENKNHISILFESKDADTIAEFLVSEVGKCDEVAYTRTITLMKPAFYPVPKDIPEGLQRFVVKLRVKPDKYHEIYDRILRTKKPPDLHFSYVAYSFGMYDIRISAIAKDWATIRAFVKNNISNLDGVRATAMLLICKSKRLTTYDTWRQQQIKYSVARLTGERIKNGFEYDWTFTDHCTVHGALPDEI